MSRPPLIRIGSSILAVVALCLAPTALGAVEAPQDDATDTAREETLPPELLSASKMLLLDTSMHFGISSEFLEALEDWGRFERVFLPDEADVCFALSTRPDFTQEQLPGEGQGTVRVIDKLYFKVFVPGDPESLWTDEIDLDDEDPMDLVLHLRQRIEEDEAEASASAESPPMAGDVPLAEELLGARTVVLRDTSGSFPLLLEFRTALDDWGRYELVPTPDAADLCFAFSSEIEYSEQPIPTGDQRTAVETEAGLRPRDEGTMRTIDTLYLRVFVPGHGEEILWADEIDAALDEPARQLVERLRQRLAQSEQAIGSAAREES